MSLKAAVFSVFHLICFLLFFTSQSARAEPNQSVVAWGDSLTYGANVTESKYAWPAQLAKIIDRKVINLGIPGQTSEGVAERQGALPVQIVFPKNTIPPSGTIEIHALDESAFVGNAEHAISGNIKQLAGSVVRQGARLFFTRATPGPAITTSGVEKFYADTSPYNQSLAVLWVCRNDVNQNLPTSKCLKNISEIAKRFSRYNQNFVVLSVLNGEGEGRGTKKYNDILLINNELRKSYPDNFLDIRNILVKSSKTSESDSSDTISSTLRSKNNIIDSQHLNDLGYHIVARSLAEFIALKGW